jgi:hypothetical protein
MLFILSALPSNQLKFSRQRKSRPLLQRIAGNPLSKKGEENREGLREALTAQVDWLFHFRETRKQTEVARMH